MLDSINGFKVIIDNNMLIEVDFDRPLSWWERITTFRLFTKFETEKRLEPSPEIVVYNSDTFVMHSKTAKKLKKSL